MSAGTGDLEGYLRPHDPDVKVEIGRNVELRTSNIRTKRAVFTFAVTAFLAGSLLVLFNSPARHELLAPGPLSAKHAQILSGDNRCVACHDAGHQSLTGWVANLFHKNENGTGQSEKCMDCHQTTLKSELALSPHNQTEEALRKLKQNSAGSSSSLVSLDSGSLHRQIACRNCHQEHHGSEDLKAMTDRQCQVCHGEVFHSFELDHPEFTQWPFASGSQIAFDHISHSQRHFKDKQEEFACQQCHVSDGRGNVQLLTGYENACAKCHDQGLQASFQSGITLFQLPMLNVAELKEQGMDVGEWPVRSTGDFDGKLPPLMRVMLSGDPGVAESLSKLGPDFEFADLDFTDRESARAAVELVWGIKRMFKDVAHLGISAIHNRIADLIERPLTDDEKQFLLNGLNDAALRDLIAGWFPDLEQEFSSTRSQRLPDRVANFEVDRLFARYRSRVPDDDKLLAKNPLQELVTYESTAQQNRDPARSEDAGSESIHGDAKSKAIDRLMGQDRAGRSRPRIRSIQQSKGTNGQTADSATMLAENPLKRLMATPDGDIALPNVRNASPLDRRTNIESVERKPIEVPQVPEQVESKETQRKTIVSGAMALGHNGWTRDDRLFQVRYQPSEHADPLLTTWLEIIGDRANADERIGTAPAFQMLTSLTSSGQCRSCHTMERLTNGRFVINWESSSRDAIIKHFTRFSHAPHLTISKLRDCKSCHEMDLGRTNAETFEDFDPKTAVSNFRPLKKSDCARCHQQGKAPNGCADCHYYHVGSPLR